MEKQYLQWLRDNQKAVNISLMNSALKLPEGTLAKWLKGVRPLPKKYVPLIDKYIKNLTTVN